MNKLCGLCHKEILHLTKFKCVYTEHKRVWWRTKCRKVDICHRCTQKWITDTNKWVKNIQDTFDDITKDWANEENAN